MKTVDMKRSAADKKAQKERWDEPVSSSGDDYHHGLHITIDHEGLGKLGIEEMPAPGDEYHGQFRGRVTQSSQDTDERSDQPRRQVGILLHHIGLEPKDKPKENPRGGLRDDIEAAADKAK